MVPVCFTDLADFLSRSKIPSPVKRYTNLHQLKQSQHFPTAFYSLAYVCVYMYTHAIMERGRDWPLYNWLQNQCFIWAWRCFISATWLVFFPPSVLYYGHFFRHPSACWTLDPRPGFAVSTQICRKLTQKMLNTNRGQFIGHSKDTQENMFSTLRYCNPD